jgi:hypothetical protein
MRSSAKLVSEHSPLDRPMSHSPAPVTAPDLYWAPLAYPLFSTTVFYLAFTAPLPYGHGLGGIGLLSLDFVLQLLLALGLFALSRNKLIFVVLQACLMALVYFSSPMKMIYFSGAPVTPYDLTSAWALFLIIDPATSWLVALPLLGLCCLFLYNLQVTRRSLLALLALFLLLPLGLQAGSPVLSRWMGSAYPSETWNLGFNYWVRGPSVYLLHETTKMLSEEAHVPSPRDVAGAIAALELTPAPLPEQTSAKPRNLHLLLVESLWDAGQLPALADSPTPFDPAFHSIWEQGGRSDVLSPVYTGGTANAEFELLCGLPVLSDRIAFEHELRNGSLPCLPQLLQHHGYRTVALHPNRKHFWNRAYAYPRLGFGDYFAEPSFVMDDLLGGRFLSDRSLLRQVRKILHGNDAPLFDYTLTIAEHHPYYPEPQQPQVSWNSGHEVVDRYLEVIRQGTQEIADHIEVLRQEDPDSLIVVLGDHSPLLGPNFEGYRAAGLIAGKGGKIDAAVQRGLASTPLIVIDGERGPLPLGQLNLYELPSRLLDLLGLPDAMPLAGTGGGPLHYRPMAGLGMLVWGDGQEYQCDSAQHPPQCRDADAWREAIQTLRLDLLRGGQYQVQFKDESSKRAARFGPLRVWKDRRYWKSGKA